MRIRRRPLAAAPGRQRREDQRRITFSLGVSASI